MKKLRVFYDWLSMIRFGFTTGCFVGVLAPSYFIESVIEIAPYFPYRIAVIYAFQLSGVLLGCVFCVCFFGAFYRSFMLRRSCTVDGQLSEEEQS